MKQFTRQATPPKKETTTMTNDQLKVEIAAENRVNQLIKDYAPQIFANAAGLVGRAIFKADGCLRKDTANVLDIPTLPERHDTIYLNRSGYSLGFTFKTCCTTPNIEPHMSDHCAYAETTVYIGDMVDGGLGPVNEFDPENYKSDYDLDTVRALQTECKKARDAYNAARSACNPFGEK